MADAAARLGVPPPISIQNDFSLLDRRFEGHLAEACAPAHYNVGLLVRGWNEASSGGDCAHLACCCGPSTRPPSCLHHAALRPPGGRHTDG